MNRLNEARKVWDKMFNGSVAEPSSLLSPELYSKLNTIFSVGDYHYYIFNVKKVSIEYVSKSMTSILGYPTDQFTLPNIINLIHPDDVACFLDFETSAVDFLRSLPIEKVMRYKIRYDYRLKKADGSYTRILQQCITFEQGPAGEVITSLGVHTDITHIKKDGKPVLSFIGMDGEPSFLDVNPRQLFSPAKELLSKREKQILTHLVSGKSSADIAAILFLSPNTISTHRRNMLEKTGCRNSSEMIAKAIREGFI